MSKKEIVSVSKEDESKIAMILGAKEVPSSGGANDRLPVLKTNTKRKDPQGRKIEEGLFFLSGIDEPIYAESVTIRVLSQMFQWIHFDPETFKVANKTLLIPNFRHEGRDMKGTIRCGKPTSRELQELSKTEQKKYADIKCYRQLRVLVSYEGKDADGVEKTVENIPAILLQKGSNFNPFEDEFMKAIPRGANLYDYTATVTSEEKTQGSVTYYVMHFEPNLDTALPLDQPTFDTMTKLAEMIVSENKMINASHDKALREANGDDEAIEALGVASLEDDLEDDTVAA